MSENDQSDDFPRPRRPRRTWDRDPVQRPHGTPRGKKGYDRGRDKEELRRHIKEELGDEEENNDVEEDTDA